VDIAIYGGSALILTFDLARTTRDVGIVAHGDAQYIRRAAGEIAEEMGWPDNWLNDGVKGFVSAHEDLREFACLSTSGEGSGGLRLYTPTPEYLFAMKCIAMRPEGMDGSHDVSDIEFLAGEIGIRDAESAFQLIEQFYPKTQIPAKTRFGVEEIMERLADSASEPTSEADSRM
jgi:hypothetical protein